MTASTGAEFHGKTVEDAIEAGLAALRLKPNQVTIEILSKGSRGLLGFGAEDARVLITPLSAVVEKAAPAPTPAKQAETKRTPETSAPPSKPAASPPPAKPAVAPSPSKPVSAPSPAKPLPAAEAATKEKEFTDAEVEAVAVELLQGMLDRMGLKTTVRAVEYKGVVDEDDDERPMVLNIEGDDLGVLIGRRSETLTAIQYLLRLMVNHRVRRWVNLEVDVEGYKARREDQLRKLAERMAERVVSTGRAVTLEAMPARERRIIHITLRNHPQVTTQSFGEGEHRKVSIIPK